MATPVHDAKPKPLARTVAIVPHTHWDREWYSPFPYQRVWPGKAV